MWDEFVKRAGEFKMLQISTSTERLFLLIFSVHQAHYNFFWFVENTMLYFILPEKIAIHMVVVQPRTDAHGHLMKRLRVVVSDEKPGLFTFAIYCKQCNSFDLFLDVKNNAVDPAKNVECGTFEHRSPKSGALPITLKCEKCMPYGKYVILQNGVKGAFGITEVGIYGIPLKL